MAQRILALAAEEGPERLQEALQSLAESEVRGAGRGAGMRRRGCSAGGTWLTECPCLAAGRHGDQAGPEGEGDGGSAEGDLQRWVMCELLMCGPQPCWVQPVLSSTGKRHFWQKTRSSGLSRGNTTSKEIAN